MSTHGVVSSKSRQKENREGLGGKKDTTKGPQRGGIGNGQYTIATGEKKAAQEHSHVLSPKDLLHSPLILDILLLNTSTEAHAYRLTDVNVPLNSYILTSGNGSLLNMWWYDDQGSGG